MTDETPSKLGDEQQTIAAIESLSARQRIAASIEKTSATTSQSQAARTDQPENDEKYIGRYCILGVIASGGMGTVFEAQQDNPSRTVAVKVMKRSITSQSTLRRFEYESQILGRLRHPGIAQVYEAGVHDDGEGAVPFFAMEYIVGARTLIDYCDAQKLNTRDRLKLFIKVCEAVHHGHQKGIIHRDLKPDNILVDSSGQPKIIDYGVARATEPDESMAMQTQVGQLVGTIQYMSPEQIEAHPDDIDTRSDVYALGVLLYKLLTGKLPYDVASLPLAEITRVIQDHVPKRLSTFDRSLRGDVETIVLHALEKDRDQRYQSTQALAQDIERYLSNHSILARSPTLVYHFRTFTRRNKALVSVACIGLAALIVGVIGTTTGWVSAKKEARISYDALVAIGDIFTSVDARDGAGPKVTVASLLHSFAETLENRSDEPEVRATLQSSIGNGFRALTLYDQAETQLREALETRRAVLSAPNEQIAQSLEDLASVLWFKGKFNEAEPMFRKALAMRRDLWGDEHEMVAHSLNYLAACLKSQGKAHEAEPLYRQALELRQRIWGEPHELIARSLNNLGTCVWDDPNRFSEAEQLFRRSVSMTRVTRGDQHIDVAGGLSNLARVLVKMDRLDEAESYFREALLIKRAALRADHASIGITLYHLAKLLLTNPENEHRTESSAGDRLKEAEAFCREALEIRSKKFNPSSRTMTATLKLLESILTARHDEDGAEAIRLQLTLPRGKS